MKDIFLCHTGADKDWVRNFADRLEQEQIRGHAISVFFDEWDIDYGESIITAIHKGLKESRYVGLVLSPAMVKADWPTVEWQSQIMADPAGKGGKILTLLRHKFDPVTGEPIDMPFALSPLKRFDFTRSGPPFEHELQNLLRKLRDQPPLRGRSRGGLGSAIATASGQETPDALDEHLPSNLFPVLSHPTILYSDFTPATCYGDVWKVMTGKQIPPFFLHAGRLYSFVPNNVKPDPFGKFRNRTDQSGEPLAPFLADPDMSRQVIGLLNSALRQHCYHLGIRSPKDDRQQFFCPIFSGGEPRTFSWGSGQRPRTLSKLKTRRDTTVFGVHVSANMRFIQLGGRLFLLVEPGWFFTTDGVTPLGGLEVGVFSTKWGGRERNASVLRNVLMWGLLLGKGKPQITLELSTEGASVVVNLQAVPTHTKITSGIGGDVIRLDRILGGEGAGELPGVSNENADDIEDTDVSSEDGDELDLVADLALVMPLPLTGGVDKRMSDDTDGEDNDATDALNAELELPF